MLRRLINNSSLLSDKFEFNQIYGAGHPNFP
jgi:hypothetical protein